MKRHPKHRSPRFKAKLALEAIRGERTSRDLAKQFRVRNGQISLWKQQLIERANQVFSGRMHRDATLDQVYRGIRPSLQIRRNSELWMLNVLLGRLSVARLANEVVGVLPRDHTEQLYSCVRNNTLRYRTRALAMLAHKKGIREVTIGHFLQVGAHYVDRVEQHYLKEGINWFSRHPHKGPRKYELEQYKKAAFQILHSPPSAHGINRTTWRKKDIKKLMSQQGLLIGINNLGKIFRNAGYKMYKAKEFLTSNDPDYEKKVQEITAILGNLKSHEKFFSIDEFGPFAVKMQGGRSYMKRGEVKIVPLYQKSKGTLIVTAALELSENQVTHFYSAHKNTGEMLKLLEILLVKYADQSCIYFSWDAASWHASKRLYKRVEEINSPEYRARHKCPLVKLAPLPSRAQFLNVIESVFSGMAKAIIHNSDYQSVNDAIVAIDRHFAERNQEFQDNPKRAGGKIWGKEIVAAEFSESNNCKDQRYMQHR